MATGANYPTSFDSYANKVTGDYLTVADVNSRSDAIEALETGPLRPSDGSAGAPAYSFQGDTDTGIWRSGSNNLDISVGGCRVLNMAGVASAVNYFVMQPATAGAGVRFLSDGTDTNIPMVFDVKGTGPLIFRRAGGATEDARISQGIVQIGTTVTSGSAGGDVVIPNTRNYNGVNGAGTSAVALIGLDTGNRVYISGNANEIRWGRPLVTMGGGSTATLGTIGGSGPATLTQNSWLPIVDSSGVPGWIPLWK